MLMEDNKSIVNALSEIYGRILTESQNPQETPKTEDPEIQPVVTEGWLDSWRAKREAQKAGKGLEKANAQAQKTAIDSAPKARRIQIGPDGKGRMGPLVGPTQTEPVHSSEDISHAKIGAMTRSLSNSFYKDLKRSGIINSNDANYKLLIDNFIRVIYVLSNYDADPTTNKPFTWTRVDRNLIGKYLRPLFESIVDNKINGVEH